MSFANTKPREIDIRVLQENDDWQSTDDEDVDMDD